MMAASVLGPFQRPTIHQTISDIIRRRSTNHADVREVALAGLDLSSKRSILDLGCGFGFMTEALVDRISPSARLSGVDFWEDDEQPYLQRATSAGHNAEFRSIQIGPSLPWPERSFDLVVCSYALYFFVEAIPEIARVLVPEGMFLAITHSERSIVDGLPAEASQRAATNLFSLMHRFSAENGRELLSPSFGCVDRIGFSNTIRFEAEHVDELLAYMRFKLPLLYPDADPGGALPMALEHCVRHSMSRRHTMVFNKSDAVFRCRSPRCHKS